MPEPSPGNWRRRLEWAHKFGTENPIVTSTFVAGVLGGLTAFAYCLTVGQAPDFTLTDALGTFVATCLAGFVVVGAIVLTCVAPGGFARFLLDSMLPEKPVAPYYWVPAENKAEPASVANREMRSTLIDGTFAVEVTALAVLLWSVWWSKGLAEFFWPANPTVFMTLHVVASVAVAALTCLGGALSRALRVNLRITVAFCCLAALALFCIHRLGFPSNVSAVVRSSAAKASNGDVPAYRQHLVVGLYACYVLAAIAGAAGTGLLISVAIKGGRNRQLASTHGPTFPKPRPSIALIRQVVAIAYVATSAFPLLTAMLLARTTGPAHATRVFAVEVFYLSLFNILFFTVASVVNNLYRSCLIAVGCISVLFIVAIQGVSIIPKTVIYALGYGNFHSPVVLISAGECPRFRAYGVDCKGGKDDAVALENVNVISRIGANATLELVVRREGKLMDKNLKVSSLVPGSDIADSRDTAATAMLDSSQVKHDSLLRTSLTSRDFAVHDRTTSIVHARQCDGVAASNLRVPNSDVVAYRRDHEIEMRMWCVKITIKKDALIDYEKDGWPSYREGYSRVVEPEGRLSIASQHMISITGK